MTAAIVVWKGDVIPGMPWCITCWICDGLTAHDLARTQPEAVAAGLEHTCGPSTLEVNHERADRRQARRAQP